MSYNPSIPQASDFISSSQADLLTNFTVLNDLFDVDHVTYDDAATSYRGHHRAVRLGEQAGDPTTLANEGAIYTKDDGSGNTDLFYRYDANGDTIRLTGDGQLYRGSIWDAAVSATNISTVPVIVTNTNVATVVASGSTAAIITFTNALPDTNYVIMAQGTSTFGIQTGQFSVASKTVNGFTIQFSISPASLTAIVLGVIRM